MNGQVYCTEQKVPLGRDRNRHDTNTLRTETKGVKQPIRQVRKARERNATGGNERDTHTHTHKRTNKQTN